ncbi:hypothetical protein FWC63_01105 [Candidatus Saccharibacteria bacterium]|nr:hypothetical protein [Candidatus Saccharibacteria bacterium]
MRKKNFNNNGPVRVSENDFAKYKRIVFTDNMTNKTRFDQLYYLWIDEKNPDGLRRLALRDMLRQSYIMDADVARCHYAVADSMRRLLRIGNKEHREDLYWLLFNRPKLLREMLGEFCYNLKNDLAPHELVGHGNGQIDELIEFLLGLVDEGHARELLSHHSASRLGADESYLLAPILVKLWSPKTKMPQAVRDEIWQRIVAATQAEMKKHMAAVSAAGHVNDMSLTLSLTPNGLEMAKGLVELVIDQSYVKGNGFKAIYPCLWLLENEIPDVVKYMSLGQIVRIAIQLEDEELALRFARRHIHAVDSRDLKTFKNQEGLVFLRWLRGLMEVATPGDEDLREDINGILMHLGKQVD